MPRTELQFGGLAAAALQHPIRRRRRRRRRRAHVVLLPLFRLPPSPLFLLQNGAVVHFFQTFNFHHPLANGTTANPSRCWKERGV